MKLWSRQKQITSAHLLDEYAAILERGPTGAGTLHALDSLPAEKPLMKAAIIARAYELGPEFLDVLRAGFITLANFQSDEHEPLPRHVEIAAEMTVLGLEFDARTKALRERSNAQAQG